MMDEKLSSSAKSGNERTYNGIIQGFEGEALFSDGARLIALSMDTYDENQLFSQEEKKEKRDGFQAAIEARILSRIRF